MFVFNIKETAKTFPFVVDMSFTNFVYSAL